MQRLALDEDGTVLGGCMVVDCVLRCYAVASMSAVVEVGVDL